MERMEEGVKGEWTDRGEREEEGRDWRESRREPKGIPHSRGFVV